MNTGKAIIFMIVQLVFSFFVENKHGSEDSTCKRMTQIMADERLRHDIEVWLEGIYENPGDWKEDRRDKFRSMGSFRIVIDDIDQVKAFGLPEHTQLLARLNEDKSASELAAVVDHGVGIVFSKNPKVIEKTTMKKHRGDNIGVVCLRPD